jgi:hypothetical protein
MRRRISPGPKNTSMAPTRTITVKVENRTSTDPTSTAVVTRTGSDTRKLHQTAAAAQAIPSPPTVARLTCVCR